MRPAAQAAFLVLSGLGSWTMVTSLFQEAGRMVCSAPEGLALFAHLDFAVELSNVLPFAYVAGGFAASRRAEGVGPALAFQVVGFGSALLAATMWDTKLTVGGKSHSAALLLAAFLAGSSGAMAMVTLLPWVSRFYAEPKAITFLSVGIGACGFASTIIATAQCVSAAHLDFSISAMFSVTALVQLAAIFATLALSLERMRHHALPAGQASVAYAAFDGFRPQDSSPVRMANTRPRKGLAAGLLSSPSLPRTPTRKDPWEQAVPALSDVFDPLATPSKSERKERQKAGATVSLLRRHAADLASIFASCFTEYAVPGFLPYMVQGAHHGASCHGRHNSTAAVAVSTRGPASAGDAGDGGSDANFDLFLLTTVYFLGSVFGRLLTLIKTPQRYSAGGFTRLRWLRKRLTALLAAAQFVLYIYALLVARAAQEHHERPPFVLSLVVMFIFSTLHGAVVTRVFRSVPQVEEAAFVGLLGGASGDAARSSGAAVARASSIAGLMNQVGALAGSAFTIVLVSIGILKST